MALLDARARVCVCVCVWMDGWVVVVLQENVINSKMSERSVHDFTAISLDNPKFQQVEHRLH